ncbi:MAG TPA: hypothetical protein VHX52_14335 [Steroidobacteraceae bacterium]|jgi:cobaltochelatase CobT|nr:hypothetical protein [Steroidobacteraceae bacterium]
MSAAVYRALATVPGGAPATDPAAVDEAGWQMLLSELPGDGRPAALARWRGRLDALAVRARYSDARRHAGRAPATKSAQMLFSLLEQNRVESLAARTFPGVRHNLEALAQERWIRARPEGVVRAAGTAWIETFALLVRAPMAAPLSPEARATLASSWRDWMSREQADEVAALATVLEDQDAFAAQALRVIAAVLGPDAVQSGPWREPSDIEQQPDCAARRVSQPMPSDPTSEQPQADAGGDPMAWAQLRTDAGSMPVPAAPVGMADPYRIYSTAFDETVTPADLSDALTLEQRRRELDQRVGPHLGGVMRWAHWLQRRLLALQMRSWQFDLEEGLLDAGRLTRVITRPLEPLAYKQETEIEFPDTVVSLLVDNSGSMRGLPIAAATVCAELLGRVLERCGIRTEVLGFTTRSWRGGRARAQWIAAGRPPHPGRLTELRHILYKSADEPWRRAHPWLGLMLDDSLLKENVDGEALLWAHARLMRRVEPRRILLVISDGAPLDDATLEANDVGYLDRHLRTVIDWIERDSAIELAAIGIGYDVSGYYRRAVTLSGAEALGEAIAAQLADLFEVPARIRAARSIAAQPLRTAGHRDPTAASA